MLMQEFVTRFSAQNEKSSLFKALRQISRLDSRALLASSTVAWAEWPPITSPVG